MHIGEAAAGLLLVVVLWAAIVALAIPRRPGGTSSRHGSRARPRAAGPPVRPGATAGTPVARRQARPCCPECSPDCQLAGLAMGQAWGRLDGWWGQPFGDDGSSTEATVFWSDGCCPDCDACPICRSP